MSKSEAIVWLVGAIVVNGPSGGIVIFTLCKPFWLAHRFRIGYIGTVAVVAIAFGLWAASASAIMQALEVLCG